jgi:hypothetical protein
MFHTLIILDVSDIVNALGQANVAPLLPMQYHLPLTYCKVQPTPVEANVMVPEPEVFQPALATVITMLPEAIPSQKF